MDVYRLRPERHREQKVLVRDEAAWAEQSGRFEGAPIGPRWRPVALSVVRTKRLQRKPLPDLLPLLSSVPAFSGRAVGALGELLSDHGELLPLACEEQPYWAFNATRVVAGLDERRSEFERFPDGRVYLITRHAFDAAAVAGCAVFKMPYMRSSDVYVTDRFVDRVAAHRLAGFAPELLWSS